MSLPLIQSCTMNPMARSCRRVERNGGGGGGGARRGSAGSRGWDSSNSLNVVLEDSELAVVAAGGGDGDGADEPSSGSALSLHSAGANGAAAAAGVAAGVAGPTNSSLRSLTSEGTGGNDSHGSMSRTGHFSIASLPAMRTSLRNSGLFSPQHRQQPRNAYGRRSSDDGLQGATPTRPRRVTMNMLGSVASAMGSSSRGRGGSSRMVQVSRGTASPAGLVRQIGARSVGGNVRRSTADLTMDGGEGGRHRRAPHVVDLDDFDYVHPRKVDEPALGGNVGIVPTNQPGHTIRVYVAEKIFYSQVRGKTFRIHSNKKADVERVQRRRLAQQPQQQEAQQQEEEQDRRQQQLHEASVGEGGEPAMPPVREISQNPETEEDESSNRAGEASCVASLSVSNYDLVGKTSHARDKLVLRDRDGHTIGVIVRRFVHYDRRYDIYGVQPVSPFQRPAGSQTTKTGEPLYLRARVIGNLKGKLSIDMFSSNNHFQTDVYRIHKLKTGFLEGKTLYITKQEKMAALVKQGAFPRGVQGPAWDGTIAPGIDPCLMLCLIAILDETNRI
mmetsp:Transcript_31471/g.92297  ORF Transcript_31471/g.92297 Transcript_31471/m.92297 type:complete len:557 (-) Transcript_31471:64-1734(-)